jgi:hypothetical protein
MKPSASQKNRMAKGTVTKAFQMNGSASGRFKPSQEVASPVSNMMQAKNTVRRAVAAVRHVTG